MLILSENDMLCSYKSKIATSAADFLLLFKSFFFYLFFCPCFARMFVVLKAPQNSGIYLEPVVIPDHVILNRIVKALYIIYNVKEMHKM